jgi:hypothetical protein
LMLGISRGLTLIVYYKEARLGLHVMQGYSQTVSAVHG